MSDVIDLPGARPVAADPALFRPDPHRGFATYRPRAGVIDLGGGVHVVTRHADISALMTDPRTRQMSTEALERAGITSGSLHAFYANSMLLSNPPDHARRRGPTARAFAHRIVQLWRPRIRTIVSEMLDELEPEGGFDLLGTLASALPSRLIAEILGAPREDAPRFAERVYAMSRGLGGFRAADFAGIETAATDLGAYVARLLEERRRAPRDDFLTAYLAKVDEAGELSPVETLMQVVTLIVAGSDTTRFGLTMLVSLLLQHRAQWDHVRSHPEAVPGAVVEALRFEPAVGSIGRVVVEPLAVDGVEFRPGTLLVLSILSAQRDERVYADPQRFDIARDDHPRWSVSFGLGPHRCLGEALARAEMEEALTVLARRLPRLEIVGLPATAKGHTGIRGITPLTVGWARG